MSRLEAGIERILQWFWNSDEPQYKILNEMSEKYFISEETFSTLLTQLFTPEERKVRKRMILQQAIKLSPSWVGGRYIIGNYWTIPKPDWYVGSKSTRIDEHVIIYCEANGLTSIPKGYHVHHKDLDKLNNDLENLVLLTISEHMKLHNLLRSGSCGININSICS